MKKSILLTSGLIAFLLPGISWAQNGAGCSGHFDIVYPSSTSTANANATTNNGTGTTLPPAASSTQQIAVTPTSNSPVLLTRTLADNTITTYNAGTVVGGTTYTFLFPPASQSATYRLTGTTVGCNNPKSLEYSLTLAPTLTLVASQGTVCAGGSTVLTVPWLDRHLYPYGLQYAHANQYDGHFCRFARCLHYLHRNGPHGHGLRH